MPINKFTTLLDLARQAKIITGETATFDGKIQAGIPFSGYPTGIDTGSTVSLGVVSSEDAIFSGNTGTTVFDVSNTGSTNYDAIFSGYTGFSWTNPLFSGNTSGLTLPITPLSASTQIVGPFWYLTQTGMTGDYVIGTQYTGYSITYSFFDVSQFGTGFTYSGFTTATQENFSAGTLDYKGPLDYISSVEDASVDGRLITNKLTVTGGASSATTGYVLTQTGVTGEVGWVFNSASGTTDTNFAITDLTFTGNRTHDLSGNYLYIYNTLGKDGVGPYLYHNASQDYISIGHGNDDFVDIGDSLAGYTGFTFKTNSLTRMVINEDGDVGIGTSSPTEKLHVDGNTKIEGNSLGNPSLIIGDNDEITFTTLGTSISNNVEINSTPNSSGIRLNDGASGLGNQFSLLNFYNGSGTYNALTANIGATDDSTFFIVNNAVSGVTTIRVGTGDTLADVIYLYGRESTDKKGPFSGITNEKITYVRDYLSVEANLSVGNANSAVASATLSLDGDGILTVDTSDERLKENISPLSGSLETILQLSGVSYNAINKKVSGEGKFYGFIAQQVDSVDSNLTFINKSDGYMGIRNNGILPLLVESIREIYNNPSIPNYTPTSSNDTYGNVGNITTDDDYLYIKTNNGWKRTSLQSF